MAVQFDDLDLSRFEKLAAVVVDLAAGVVDGSEGGEVPAEAKKKIEHLTDRVALLETTVAKLRRHSTDVLRGDGDSGRTQKPSSGPVRLSTGERTLQIGSGATPTPRLPSSAPLPAGRAAVGPARSTPSAITVPEERFSPDEFTSLLRAGQPLERSRRFHDFSPTNPDEAILTSGLEKALDWQGIVRAAAGRVDEGRILEILVRFYDRKLVDFD